MDTQQVVKVLKDGLDGQLSVDNTTDTTVFATVGRQSLRDVTALLQDRLGARFLISAGVDHRTDLGVLEAVNMFALDKDKLFVSLRTEVDPLEPSVDSIADLIPGAAWTEREMRDMVGIVPEGHPDPRRLVLPDDWPDDLYPLRRDVPYNVNPPAEDRAVEMQKPPEGATTLPIGPFFPTLEEPVFFNLFVNGEDVVGMDYRGFFNHRGIEKMGDSKLTYNQIPFIAERICGICGFVHSCSYCQAVEVAAGIEVPPRGNYIRSIVLELERVHSHLLWVGLACHFIGFDTLFMQAWRIREPVMWLCEQVTGHRKTYGSNLIGGVRRDISDEMRRKILEVLDQVEKESRAAVDAIIDDQSLMMRLKGTGLLTREKAEAYCVVGPTARGSDVAIDARVDHPYAAYAELPVKVCSYPDGDNLARTLVRIDELFDAINQIRVAIDNLPPGDILADVGEIPPGKKGLVCVEAPRGEVFHYVETGLDNRPYRWRVRAPSYVNLQAIPAMLENQKVADAPITVGSIDPCFSCTERIMITDAKSGKRRIVSGKELVESRS